MDVYCGGEVEAHTEASTARCGVSQTRKVVSSYLDIIVVRGKALRPLGSDVNIGPHQRPKVTLQLLLNLPQLLLLE